MQPTTQKSTKVIPDQVLNYQIPEVEGYFSSKHAVIYALGIGFSRDPKDEDDLRFTYELKDDFAVFPTVGTTFLTLDKAFDPMAECPGIPKFHPMSVLHGEHKLEFLKPLQPNMKLVTTRRIADIADKGKGALVTFEFTTYEVDENGARTPVQINTLGLFIRGHGGFGYKGKSTGIAFKIPDRKPDVVIEEKTLPNQALYYRLAGDDNPLHADPKMAKIGGFDKPILHGLCFYGICNKLVVKAFCGGNPDKMRSSQARFTSSIFPGETIQLSAWKEGNKVIYSGKTAQRGKEIIQGEIELDECPNSKL